MKLQQQVLGAWDARTEPSSKEHFTAQSRQRIAALFLDATSSHDEPGGLNGSRDNHGDPSAELVQLALSESLSAPFFRAELRNCQLCVFDILMTAAIEDDVQQDGGAAAGALQSMAGSLTRLDDLIRHSFDQLVASGDTADQSIPAPAQTTGKRKTLQHEIRTPLQGALLTTELMLEDAGQGDPVSAEDILAVRNSIETAVGILNDFASRSNPG